MELPFKYIVLGIIKKLKDRHMSLMIDKTKLIDYFSEIVRRAYFTIEDKKDIGNNFDFDYELDSLLNKYYKYIDMEDNKIIFDNDYIDEIDRLLLEEKNEFDDYIMIHDIDFIIWDNIVFLDIIGVKINKDLYNYLFDIEKELEESYEEMCRIESYIGIDEVDTSKLINKIKELKIKKIIMLINSKNLLSLFEYDDLTRYACYRVDKENEQEEVTLLLDDDSFDDSDIMYDVFLRSIFTGGNSCASNLRESLGMNGFEKNKDVKYSILNFYLTFLYLLEKEIGTSDEVLSIELTDIKYRVINTMDSIYDTALFMGNRDIIPGKFKENYSFIRDAIYYFIKELLMYDDDKYRNEEYGTDNVMVYLNNIVKKLLIENYYILTKDEKVIDIINNSGLYGVNTISSGFLKNIVDKPKSKIKEK